MHFIVDVLLFLLISTGRRQGSDAGGSAPGERCSARCGRRGAGVCGRACRHLISLAAKPGGQAGKMRWQPARAQTQGPRLSAVHQELPLPGQAAKRPRKTRPAPTKSTPPAPPLIVRASPASCRCTYSTALGTRKEESGRCHRRTMGVSWMTSGRGPRPCKTGNAKRR